MSRPTSNRTLAAYRLDIADEQDPAIPSHLQHETSVEADEADLQEQATPVAADEEDYPHADARLGERWTDNSAVFSKDKP